MFLDPDMFLKGTQSGTQLTAATAVIASLPAISRDHPDCWIVDSGASHHCTSNRADFHDFQPESTPFKVKGVMCDCHGKGTVCLDLPSTSGSVRVELKGVLYLPDLAQRTGLDTCRLMSIPAARKTSSASFVFRSDGQVLQLRNGPTIPFTLLTREGLYVLPSRLKQKGAIAAPSMGGGTGSTAR